MTSLLAIWLINNNYCSHLILGTRPQNTTVNNDYREGESRDTRIRIVVQGGRGREGGREAGREGEGQTEGEERERCDLDDVLSVLNGDTSQLRMSTARVLCRLPNSLAWRELHFLVTQLYNRQYVCTASLLLASCIILGLENGKSTSLTGWLTVWKHAVSSDIQLFSTNANMCSQGLLPNYLSKYQNSSSLKTHCTVTIVYKITFIY